MLHAHDFNHYFTVVDAVEDPVLPRRAYYVENKGGRGCLANWCGLSRRAPVMNLKTAVATFSGSSSSRARRAGENVESLNEGVVVVRSEEDGSALAVARNLYSLMGGLSLFHQL